VLIALTGGPCGGKTTLIDELSRDSRWAGRFVALPEAITQAGRLGGISITEKAFQKEMVRTQIIQEDKAHRGEATGLVICHRGSLDPLAYWLDRGWPEAEFFEYTGTTFQQHYRRYTAVIHLVTAADGAEHAYRRWPEAHRHERVEDAIRLDQRLEQVWSGHSQYHRIDNLNRDWPAKSSLARQILAQYLS
jgi:predicted ATPase